MMSRFSTTLLKGAGLIAPLLVVLADTDDVLIGSCVEDDCDESACPVLYYFELSLDGGTPPGCDGPVVFDETENDLGNTSDSGHLLKAEGVGLALFAEVHFKGKVCNRNKAGTLRFWQEIDVDVRYLHTRCEGLGELYSCWSQECGSHISNNWVNDGQSGTGTAYCSGVPGTTCSTTVDCEDVSAEIKDVDHPSVFLRHNITGILCEVIWTTEFKTHLIWESSDGTEWIVSTIPWETCGYIEATTLPDAACGGIGVPPLADVLEHGEWRYACVNALKDSPGETVCTSPPGYHATNAKDIAETHSCPTLGCPCEDCD